MLHGTLVCSAKLVRLACALLERLDSPFTPRFAACFEGLVDKPCLNALRKGDKAAYMPKGGELVCGQ